MTWMILIDLIDLNQGGMYLTNTTDNCEKCEIQP